MFTARNGLAPCKNRLRFVLEVSGQVSDKELRKIQLGEIMATRFIHRLSGIAIVWLCSQQTEIIPAVPSLHAFNGIRLNITL